MKRIYLIRHGRPAFPEGKSMCIGTTDLPLAPQGYDQARAMAQALPPVAAVYASPMIRCVHTARALGQPVTVLEGLRENHAGQWEGLTFEAIRQRYPELYAARGRDISLLPPGAETREAGLERFCGCLAQIASDSPGDCAVVTHGGITALFLEMLTGVFRKPAYGEVVTLTWEAGQFHV